jgi:hypothetical protein
LLVDKDSAFACSVAVSFPSESGRSSKERTALVATEARAPSASAASSLSDEAVSKATRDGMAVVTLVGVWGKKMSYPLTTGSICV